MTCADVMSSEDLLTCLARILAHLKLSPNFTWHAMYRPRIGHCDPESQVICGCNHAPLNVRVNLGWLLPMVPTSKVSTSVSISFMHNRRVIIVT